MTPQTLSPTPAQGKPDRWPRRDLDLEELRAETRRLLDREPALRGDEREAVVREVIDVDLQLERMSLRARWTVLATEDLVALQDCSLRLERLRCCWVPAR